MEMTSHICPPVSRQPLQVISDLKWGMNCDECVHEHPHLKTNGTTVSEF